MMIPNTAIASHTDSQLSRKTDPVENSRIVSWLIDCYHTGISYYYDSEYLLLVVSNLDLQ